jgi:hypothetical protein
VLHFVLFIVYSVLILFQRETFSRGRKLSFTRWFKYDRDYLCVNKSQFDPVIFKSPWIFSSLPLLYLKTGNKCFERVEQFKYLGTTRTIQTSIREWSRLKSENVCYHSVQNLLSSSLLSKNVNIEIYRTIIFLVVLYVCWTWSFTLRNECRLRVSRIVCWGGYLGPRGRRLYNELYALYSSPNIRVIKFKTMRLGGGGM